MSIKVAIVGVGNCASSLVQGIEYYKDIHEDIEVAGLIHTMIGGYLPKDIEFVAAYDVDKNKIGLDLSQAIVAPPNNTEAVCIPGFLDVTVNAAPRMDGVGSTSKDMIECHELDFDVISTVKELSKADILVNYLPVGSEQATCFWADLAIRAGCAFINAIPVHIACDEMWANRFKDASLPILGDDVKSQVGATILHREIVKLCRMRGFSVDRTYQLNFGGNMDFYNMLDRSRLATKKVSKTYAVHSELAESDLALEEGNTHISPSDYVPWLEDRKWAYIRLEGRAFGGVPYAIETKLEVWDSPNSAGVVLDLIRCAKVALDKGMGGVIDIPCAFYFKSPRKQMDDSLSFELLREEFVNA